MLKVQEKHIINHEITKPESWLPDRPRRASLETQLWIGALAFVETVLDLDTESRYSFFEIVRQWEKRGCQQIINDAVNDHFNSYDHAARLMQAKQTQRSMAPLTSFSAKLQEYETEINNGNFKNNDYVKLTSLVREFVKIHCNRQFDYENDTCKITIEKSPRLYSVLIIKPLYIHLHKNPDDIDKKRFGDLFNVVYGNPNGNREKNVKSHLIEHWARLEWQLHNDSYYSHKADLFYRAKVNKPGKLVLLVDEISRRDKRKPRTVKRQIQSMISLIKCAVMPGIADDDLE